VVTKVPWPTRSQGHWLAILLLGVAMALAAWRPQQVVEPSPRFQLPDRSAPLKAQLSTAQTLDVPMPTGMPAAHASNLVAIPGSEDLRAAWFAGSRESGSDVVIATSRYSAAKRQWGEAVTLIDRPGLGQALGFAVRRLGNPVLWLDAAKQLHLFVVATGPGGWAASRIAHVQFVGEPMRCIEEPQACTIQARVLPLSPLWNVSHLVRHAPAALEDGGMVLPAYFELGRKYPVALRFDARGQLLGWQRLSATPTLLQPALVSTDGAGWTAFLRDTSPARRIHSVSAQAWGQPPGAAKPLELPNPNAAVAAIRIPDGSIVMAFNPSEKDRRALVLAQGDGAGAWTMLGQLESSGIHKGEYSYPALALTHDRSGQWTLHASYTFERRSIRHVAVALKPAAP
jgi:predicted neuraminidase